MNREEWLTEASKYLVPKIQAHTRNTIPNFYVSVGFPKGHSGRQRAIGQCWAGALSKDNNPHIFICPTLDDPTTVLATLIHEIIHTAHPIDGHKIGFSLVADACGLVKPWTATTAGPKLSKELAELLTKLEPYPHAALSVPKRGKVGSRMRKHLCNRCGSIVYKGADVFNAMCLEEIADSNECNGMFMPAKKYNDEPDQE